MSWTTKITCLGFPTTGLSEMLQVCSAGIGYYRPHCLTIVIFMKEKEGTMCSFNCRKNL